MYVCMYVYIYIYIHIYIYIYIYIYILETHRADARRRNPSCIVEPDKTKVYRLMPTVPWTPGDTQPERPFSIRGTGNFQATSKRIPRDFQDPPEKVSLAWSPPSWDSSAWSSLSWDSPT